MAGPAMENRRAMKMIPAILAALTLGATFLACAAPADIEEADEPVSAAEAPTVEPEATGPGADLSAEEKLTVVRALRVRAAVSAVLQQAEDPTNPETIARAEEAAEAARAAVDPTDPGLDAEVAEAILNGDLPEAMLSLYGQACRAACWAAAGMGCAAVSGLCTGTTVITIGGTTIPCLWAGIAACGAVGAGASVCSDQCPP